jgi:pimeloyl-ACP methyl ester carboxylesterase
MNRRVTKRRAGWFLGCVCLMLVGCASHHSTHHQSSASSSSTSVARRWPCLVGVQATAATVPSTPAIRIVSLGSAANAVVVSNESDQDLCGWLPFAATLASSKLRVVLYDYASDPETDLLAVANYLRSHGAARVALLGASVGADASIRVASRLTPAPAALVTLSAEGRTGGAEKKIICPALFVTAAQDPYGSAAAGPVLLKSAAAAHKRLVVVSGSLHGTALFSDPTIGPAVRAFLARYDA